MAAAMVLVDRRLAAVARARLRLNDVPTSPDRRRAVDACQYLVDARSSNSPSKRPRPDVVDARPPNPPSKRPRSDVVDARPPNSPSKRPRPDVVDVACRTKPKLRAHTDDVSSSPSLYHLEQWHDTIVVLSPRDRTPRPMNERELRRIRVRTLIEESNRARLPMCRFDDAPSVDTVQCFVCVESTLQRAMDHPIDGEDDHQNCVVARGAMCAQCAARHLATSSRCPACRRRWTVDNVHVVLATSE